MKKIAALLLLLIMVTTFLSGCLLRAIDKFSTERAHEVTEGAFDVIHDLGW